MTAKELYKEIRDAACYGYCTHISGTKAKMTRVNKMIADAETYNKVDFDLGLIDEATYNRENEVIKLMKASMKIAYIF